MLRKSRLWQKKNGFLTKKNRVMCTTKVVFTVPRRETPVGPWRNILRDTRVFSLSQPPQYITNIFQTVKVFRINHN